MEERSRGNLKGKKEAKSGTIIFLKAVTFMNWRHNFLTIDVTSFVLDFQKRKKMLTAFSFQGNPLKTKGVLGKNAHTNPTKTINFLIKMGHRNHTIGPCTGL